MSAPFIGEIRIFAFNFAPTGWALCNGQLMPISQNTSLYALLGTTYGGDGRTTFGLPNLQGSAPLQAGQGPGLGLYDLGEAWGEQAITLLQWELPAHSHSVRGTASAGFQSSPVSAVWATARVGRQFENHYAQTAGNGQTMNVQALSITGGGSPHNNMPPYLVLNFCIALQGLFPARP